MADRYNKVGEGDSVVATTPFERDHFDSLPLWVKEILWDGHIDMQVTSGPNTERMLAAGPESLRRQVRWLQRQDTLLVYGPDHPQAAGEDETWW